MDLTPPYSKWLGYLYWLVSVKNWSLIYPDRRTAALAPAYDFVSTIPYIPGDEAALKFSRTKRFDAFSEDELNHLAAKAGLPQTLVIDTARESIAGQENLPNAGYLPG